MSTVTSKKWRKVTSSNSSDQPATVKLASSMSAGEVITGIYRGAVMSKKHKDLLYHRFLQPDGSVIVLGGTARLNKVLNSISLDSEVRITYNGKKKLSKGNYAGTSYHDFEVEVAE